MQKRVFLQTIVAVLLLTGFFVAPLQAQSRGQYGRPRTLGNGAVKDTIPTPSHGPARNYAILIGVNEYQQQRKLDFCAKDMEGLKDALIKGKFTTPENIEILVTGSKDESMVPTMENINRTLKNLAAKTKENDTVLFAFAGHGVSLPSRKGGKDFQQYLCPMDAKVEVDADTGKFITDTLLPLEDIDRMLVEVSRAKTRIMFLDACRDQDVVVKTRSLGRSLGREEVVDLKGLAPQALDARGLFRLSSCADNQKAYEDPDAKHGVFSRFLIRGLNGEANENGDNKITLDELKVYVEKWTSTYVRQKFEADQHPTFSALDVQGSSPIMAYCEPKVEKPVVVPTPPIGGGASGGSMSGNATTRQSNNYGGGYNGGRSSGGGNSGFSRSR